MAISLTKWAAKRAPDALGQGKDRIVSYTGEVHNTPRGSVLQARREALGASRKGLASFLGLTVDELAAVEGEHERDVRVRQRISDALGRLEGEQRAARAREEAGR